MRTCTGLAWSHNASSVGTPGIIGVCAPADSPAVRPRQAGHLVVGLGIQEVLHTADDVIPGRLTQRQRPDSPLHTKLPCIACLIATDTYPP